MNQLDRLFIYLSWDCNLKCKHCWIFDNIDQNSFKPLNPESLMKVLNEAHHLGVKNIKISGGEPLLYKNLIQIIDDFCYNKNISILIETNGTTITDEFLCSIRSKVSFAISLDSQTKEYHDYLRGVNGAFDKAVSGLKKVLDKKKKCSVTYSFSNENLGNIPNMIEFSKKLGISSLKLNPIMLIGNGQKNFSTNNAYWPFAVSFEDLVKIYYNFCGMNDNLYVDMMVPYSLFFIKRMIKNNVHFGTCDPNKIISILPDGTIALCAEGKRDDQFLFGNIANNHLEDIVNCEKRTLLNSLNNNGCLCKKCKVYTQCLKNCKVICGERHLANPYCEELMNRGLFPPSLLK